MNNLRRSRRKTSDLRSEGVRVSFQNDSDSFLSNTLVFDVVAAAIAIAIATVLATCKALTVQLQASRVLTVAVLAR